MHGLFCQHVSALIGYYKSMVKEDHKKIDPEIAGEILDAVSRVKYGEVVVTIYDSRVVQIEKKEKKRFS